MLASSTVILLLVVVVIVGVVGFWLYRTQNKGAGLTSQPGSMALAIPEVVIIGDEDAPLAEVRAFAMTIDTKLDPLPPDQARRLELGGILQHAGGILKNGSAASKQTYVLTFAPEVAKGVERGEFKIMQAGKEGIRAIARSKDGRIVGQGILEARKGAQVLAASAAVWQVMALVTAQVHLTEINGQLQQIKGDIDQIQQFLETQEKAKLLHSIDYLDSASRSLAAQLHSEQEIAVLSHQVEDIWRECGQIARALRLRRDAQPEKFQQLSLKGWFDLKSSLASARAAIDSYEQLSCSFLLAMATRSANLQGFSRISRGCIYI
jgi:hypothetical protein